MADKKVLTGSQILCESLIKEGVKVAFGYPGGVLIPFYDALLDYSQIKHVLPRHEQGAAFAADGYARVSKEVGVCIGTSGPGVMNLLTGIANAYLDSVPMLVIAGQVTTGAIGSDAFQEVDATGITIPFTKHNFLVEDVKDLAEVIKESFYIAKNGRPGPVLIDVPKDVLLSSTEFKYPSRVNLPGFKPKLEGSDLQIKKAAKLINNSKRPILITGHGTLLSGAEKELISFAKKADIPTTYTLLGIGAVPTEHKLEIGMIGMHGSVAANLGVHECDLIIACGIRFDDRITGKLDEFAKGAKIIHIDIDPAEISKNCKADIPIVGDLKHVLKKLTPQVSKVKCQDWWKKINSWKREHPLRGRFEKTKKSSLCRAGFIIEEISDQFPEATVVADVGQNQMWTAQCWNFKKPNTHLSSGGLGSMGYALPAAIGAQIANPKAQVWTIVGDGGFQMNLQELQTVIQEKLNLKIAILNNGFLGMVRQWQDLFHEKRYSSTRITSPDFLKLSEAFGIPAFKVKKQEEVKKTIAKIKKIKGPVLCEFFVEPEENVFPMVAPAAALKDVMVG